MLVDDRFKVTAGNTQNPAIRQSPQPDRVLVAVDKTELAGKITLSENGETRGIAGTRMLDDFQLALEQYVQRIVGSPFLDQVIT